MIAYSQKKYFFFSFSLHMLFFLFFSFPILMHPFFLPASLHTQKQIPVSYFVSLRTASPLQDKPALSKAERILSLPSRPRSKPIPQKNTDTEHPEKNKTPQKILILLHEAIAEKESLLGETLESNQKGVVRIGFLLHPNGFLSKISILKSSQIENLDSAAISAVKSISPIKEAGTYLKKETFFTVEVVFE